MLQQQLEATNDRFQQEVQSGNHTFEGPMQRIAEGLSELEEPQSVTNKALMYLLGREDQPLVAEVLAAFYERSLSLSKHWIVTGQEHGVIPVSVDAERTSELFVLMALGVRVRSSLPVGQGERRKGDFARFIADMLQAGAKEGREGQ
ncbi:TetR/AcrR family transcriptional regulator [Paenibacillus sp. CC-CFT747]|nr:TetR/AcrR family transcriptional regulator [Paenibacillus sp. CC-CFT747]